MSPDPQTSQDDATPVAADDSQTGSLWLHVLRRFGLIILALAIAGLVSAYWLTHRPKASRQRPPTQAALVEVVPVALGDHVVRIQAMGTVVPAREVALASRVGGEVLAVEPSFEPGGRFDKGERILQVDPADYEIALKEAEAALEQRRAAYRQACETVEQRAVDVRMGAITIRRRELELKQKNAAVIQAESALALEKGQQLVAKEEYGLLGESVGGSDEALVLRQPQLRAVEADVSVAEAARGIAGADLDAAKQSRDSAEVLKRTAEAAAEAANAAVEAAEAARDRAALNRARTQVAAPFNALVVERQINIGSQVSMGSTLGMLVSTDAYWVRVALPVDELKWIDIPGVTNAKGAPAVVRHAAAWGVGVARKGQVVRLMGDLETAGRMARVLVSIPDPLDLGEPGGERHPLLLGSFVQVEIEGHTLTQVVQVPRSALRSGRAVWIMTPEHKLEIRPVEVVWSGDDFVYVGDGLREGEQLVVSDLGGPVADMLLQTEQDMAELQRAEQGAPGKAEGRR